MIKIRRKKNWGKINQIWNKNYGKEENEKGRKKNKCRKRILLKNVEKERENYKEKKNKRGKKKKMNKKIKKEKRRKLREKKQVWNNEM